MLLFWTYFILIFGTIGAMMVLFLKESFPKSDKKKKFDMNKTTGTAIAALVFGFIISLMIKYVRGNDTDFISLYTIVTVITFLIMFFLVKQKEKRKARSSYFIQ